MKFVHIADLHFDAPFVRLNANNRLDSKLRENQCKVFEKVINYIKENKIEFLFISGDLYENDHVKESTIEYINNLFKEIEDTEIFISPGNHDPYLKNGYYRTYNWCGNVHIFDNEIRKYSYENIDIYGYGFDDFYVKNSNVENIVIENKNKTNILVVHGSLDTSVNIEKTYNPLSYKKLQEIGFDYIALGHIHQTNYTQEEKIVYSGSLVATGFDEIGNHGMVVGDIKQDIIETEFITLDDMGFEELEIDITEMEELDQIIEKINSLETQDNLFYKIILVGNRKFNIELSKINKSVIIENIIKIKDETKLYYDLEKIANENSVKGYFVKELLERQKIAENKEEIQKAIEIGLELL